MIGLDISAQNKQGALTKAAEHYKLPTEAFDAYEKGSGDEPLHGTGPVEKMFKVSLKNEYLIKKGIDFVQMLLNGIGIEAKVEGSFKNEELVINVESRSNKDVIGRKGEFLEAIQHLTSRVMTRNNEIEMEVLVDVGRYWENRKEKIIDRVQSTAEKVLRTNQKVSLFPMSPQERKIAHIKVKEYQGLQSYSLGKEGHRFVVISPDNENNIGEKLK